MNLRESLPATAHRVEAVTDASVQDEIDALRGDFRPARDARGAVDQVVSGAVS